MVNTALESVNATIASQNLSTLGYLVWWSLNDVEIAQADAEAMAQAMGFDPKKVCPQIEARGGLVKALESLGFRASPQSGKKTADENVRLFYDRLSDTNESIVIGVYEREIVQSLGPVAQFRQRQRITYDRKTKAISLDTPFMETDIRTAFLKYCKTYRANEVRRIIQNILEMGSAITVREAGGVYFVPDKYAEVLDPLRGVGNNISGVSLVTLGIVDTVESRGEMAFAAAEEIQAEIAKASADLDALFQRKAEGQKVREGTLGARIEEFKRLRLKTESYRDLVSMESDEMAKALAVLTEKVEQALGL